MALIKRKSKPVFEFSESNIADLIAKSQSCFCTSYDILIPNCYTQHDNEADVFAIRRSGLCDEFEIKISRSDFFNDAKKSVNYRDCDWDGKDEKYLLNEPNWRAKKLLAPWQKLKYDALIDGDLTANYFWYVIKKGEVELTEIPDFAGVVFVDELGEVHRIRSPKKLHKRKVTSDEKYHFIRKLAFRYWDYRLNRR